MGVNCGAFGDEGVHVGNGNEDPDRSVGAAGGDPAAVRGEGDSPDQILVPRKRGQESAGRERLLTFSARLYAKTAVEFSDRTLVIDADDAIEGRFEDDNNIQKVVF